MGDALHLSVSPAPVRGWARVWSSAGPQLSAALAALQASVDKSNHTKPASATTSGHPSIVLATELEDNPTKVKFSSELRTAIKLVEVVDGFFLETTTQKNGHFARKVEALLLFALGMLRPQPGTSQQLLPTIAAEGPRLPSTPDSDTLAVHSEEVGKQRLRHCDVHSLMVTWCCRCKHCESNCRTLWSCRRGLKRPSLRHRPAQPSGSILRSRELCKLLLPSSASPT